MTNEQLIPVGIAIAAGASVYGLDWLWRWLFRSKRRQMKAFATAVRTVRKYFQDSTLTENEYTQLTMEQLEKIVWDHEHGWIKVSGNRIAGDARAEIR